MERPERALVTLLAIVGGLLWLAAASSKHIMDDMVGFN